MTIGEIVRGFDQHVVEVDADVCKLAEVAGGKTQRRAEEFTRALMCQHQLHAARRLFAYATQRKAYDLDRHAGLEPAGRRIIRSRSDEPRGCPGREGPVAPALQQAHGRRAKDERAVDLLEPGL